MERNLTYNLQLDKIQKKNLLTSDAIASASMKGINSTPPQKAVHLPEQ